ncbi:hypothetical protein H4R18_000190 [Coemansia javaensis]|uniref:H/ACA ribonucleoprotein complex subunit n=1 Tax=Coemansia javaensis TaxID=2761396 RepID=A0A9W8HIU1_9FUNG|nr:hypothetical protein H4R18_000190 [Coemansia javaensis]
MQEGESSDTESSSGSDFDVDDDDSDGRKVVSDDDDDDGGMGGGGMGGSSSVVLTTRHEITDPPIPEPAVRQIPETAQLCALGTIRSVVGASVTIQSQLSGETHVLDTESLVAFEDRSVLGAVYDVFGPVARPVYTVRLRSPEEARDGRCAAGRPVFYALGWARMLATDRLRTKGNDASNEYDEEVGSDAMDFSDDDAEMAFRRQRKRERAERATGKAVPPLPLPTAPPPPPPPAAQSSAPSVAGRKLQSYEDICDPDLGF